MHNTYEWQHDFVLWLDFDQILLSSIHVDRLVFPSNHESGRGVIVCLPFDLLSTLLLLFSRVFLTCVDIALP